jgi:hypothetical protein
VTLSIGSRVNVLAGVTVGLLLMKWKELAQVPNKTRRSTKIKM